MTGFKEFYDKTKIDLVFTGVNSTRKQVGIWSRKTTPNFPIADAVSISMNIPFLFKPVRVDPSMELIRVGANAMRYDGYWVDGGVLNNLPLHAFDDFDDNPNRDVLPGLSGLHPKVLGLRLTPGFPKTLADVADPTPPVSLDQPFFYTLSAYLGDILETLMSPSEEGQIRTPWERSQTIELFTGDLSLTEFAPPESKSEWPVKNAKEIVARYFAQKSK